LAERSSGRLYVARRVLRGTAIVDVQQAMLLQRADLHTCRHTE
jgi:hypothetical protein